ncbi:MAG: thioredoxin domain-containing protein [Parcubacteria group bacterium]
MLENNSSPKVNFFLGFFAGLALIAVVGFFVMLGIVFSNKQAINSAASAQPTADAIQPAVDQPAAVQEVPAVNSDDFVLGNKDSKVTVILYTDFECPFCLTHHEQTVNNLVKDYVDTNKIKFVLRNYPLSFHANAQKAAEAFECAAELGKGWEMMNLLFSANKAQTMSVDQWKTDAKTLKLNTSKFNDCLDSGKYAKKIADIVSAAVAAGVDGTPATFINGRLIGGAQPYDMFKQAIDGLL